MKVFPDAPHNTTTRPAACFLLAVVGTLGCNFSLLAQTPPDLAVHPASGLSPRALPQKPALIHVPSGANQGVLAVKFKAGRAWRAYGGSVYGLGRAPGEPALDFTATQPVLASLVERADSAARAGRAKAPVRAYWYPLHHMVSEAQLDKMRAQAEANSGGEMPDLNATMLVTVPPGFSAEEMANRIKDVDEIEYVEPILRPVSMTPPDLQPFQDYLEPLDQTTGRFGGPAGGINAEYVWNTFGTRGNNTSVNGTRVKVGVIELSANLAHADLAGVVNLGGGASGDGQHGTAVLSIIGANNNNYGVTGIASACELSIAFDAADVVGAMWAIYNRVGPGGIINASQGVAALDNRVVPLTYSQTYYNTIYTINQNGCAFVLAAGNDGANLDDSYYDPGHHPFTTSTIPGVMYVGAGAVAGTNQNPRSRCQFNSTQSSSYGTFVNLQGWGLRVEAADTENINVNYTGGAYANEGLNLAYTEGFAGTSAAAPIVTGVAALLQAANLRQTGQFLTPNQLKKKLKRTGTPQTDGIYPASQKIGKQPNLRDATFYLLPAPTQQAAVPQPPPEEGAYEPAFYYQPYPTPGHEEP